MYTHKPNISNVCCDNITLMLSSLLMPSSYIYDPNFVPSVTKFFSSCNSEGIICLSVYANSSVRLSASLEGLPYPPFIPL